MRSSVLLLFLLFFNGFLQASERSVDKYSNLEFHLPSNLTETAPGLLYWKIAKHPFSLTDLKTLGSSSRIKLERKRRKVIERIPLLSDAQPDITVYFFICESCFTYLPGSFIEFTAHTSIRGPPARI